MAPGRGLFVAVDTDEDIDTVQIPEGTLISGYSKAGTWAPQWEGDKTVAFAFDSPDTAVVYDKELMPLIEAVSIADGVSENITAGLVGHVLFFDEETQELRVAPDPAWPGLRYFIPEADPKEWGPVNLVSPQLLNPKP